MVSAVISGHFVSLRPCTHAGHAGRLVERRKEERRQRTRLLQSAARLAVDRPPCSLEPLKSSPPTKAIRKMNSRAKIYPVIFSPLVSSSVWHPPLIPLSLSLFALRYSDTIPSCWRLEVLHANSSRHQQRRWARHSAFNPRAQHPGFCVDTDVWKSRRSLVFVPLCSFYCAFHVSQ